MFGRKTLPAGILFMVLIVALAGMAVVYGLWSETLIINGVVETGSVDAALSLEEVDQSGDFNDGCPAGGFTIGQDCDGDGELNDDMEAEDKDIAECAARLSEDGNTLDVVVTNAYPSFNCFVRWNVENNGTIPIHVYNPAYFYDGAFQGSAINNAALHVNGWPPGCYSTGEGYVQLEPGEAAFCNLHIHPNQGAEPGATYEFQVQIFARQWNEVVAPPWLAP